MRSPATRHHHGVPAAPRLGHEPRRTLHPRGHGVQHQHPLNPLRRVQAERERGVAAPVVADHVRTLDAQRVQQRHGVGGERQRVVAPRRAVAPAEPAQVRRDQPVVAGQQRDHVAPAPGVLGPAVQQQHRRGARVAGLQHVQVQRPGVGGRDGDRAVPGTGHVGWGGGGHWPCAALSRRRTRARSATASTMRGQICGGRSWPMPSISISSAPGMAAAVALPPEGRTSVSSLPWTTSVGAVDPAQLARAVARLQHRRHLAAGAGRVARAVEGEAGALAHGGGIDLESGGPDGAPQQRVVVHVGRALARRGAQQEAVAAGSGLALQAVPRRRHDRRQRAHALGAACRHGLGHHAAQRSAHHVGRGQVQLAAAGRPRRRPCRRGRTGAGRSGAWPVGSASAPALRSRWTGRRRGCRSAPRGSRARPASRRSGRPSPAAACPGP